MTDRERKQLARVRAYIGGMLGGKLGSSDPYLDDRQTLSILARQTPELASRRFVRQLVEEMDRDGLIVREGPFLFRWRTDADEGIPTPSLLRVIET